MESLQKVLATIERDFFTALHKAQSMEDLEAVRIAFLGRNGSIARITEEFKQLPPEEKRTLGPLINALKQSTAATFEQAKKALLEKKDGQALLKKRHFDVTAYRQTEPGSLHIYTHIMNEITTVLSSMGFAMVDGPEVETDYYNFQALNIPEHHPARDMQDTFWIDVPTLLLRTQTSPVQIRSMETMPLPLAVFAPGRVYRNEALDASHEFMFTQVEVLLVDQNVSLANLLATAHLFLQKLFGNNKLTIRVRPGYFPFVEPGLEIDASCPFCTEGCSTCKKTGWIELLGAGLVHPNVLQCSGIDTDRYSGFAFGLGIERLAMIKYGIKDIRVFHANKIEFLKQF